MPLDPKTKPDIEYLRILAQEVQGIPAWKEMAEAARQIIGAEVDDRRRKLQKIRDSVTHRRGDVLVNVDYEPEAGKPMVDAVTQQPFFPTEPVQFRTATVKNVIQNLRYATQTEKTSDYLDLEVTYKGQIYRWLKPFTWNQERDILLKNAYRLGFNFFNTKLSDQDLQRVVEFIQIYWNEAGSDDNFMKFIGFIKNTRFDLVALWTEGPAEPPDTPGASEDFKYPYLEEFDPNRMKSVSEGGEHWLTSHVEIRYDLAQFNKFYTVNLDDIEQLFYYFAPIILVLERIVGTLTVDTPLVATTAVDVAVYEQGSWAPPSDFHTDLAAITALDVLAYEPAVFGAVTRFIIETLVLQGFDITVYAGSSLNTEKDGCLALDSIVNLSQDCFDFRPYLVALGVI